MRLFWVGGPTARVEIGSFRILTDPMLGDGTEAFIMRRHPSTGQTSVPIARLAPLPSIDVDDLDMVIASHLHSDHFDARAVEQLNKDLELVAPTAHLPQLREWGFGRLAGLEWDQEKTWLKNGERLRVLALPAHHAHDEQADHELGVVNGYLIEHQTASSTFALYWTGDTVWFDALADTAQNLQTVNLLLPHMGGVGKDGGPWGMISLDAVEGTRVVEVINPDTVIPMHHSTFPFYVEPIDQFAARLDTSSYAGKLVILNEGDSWTSH